MPANQEQTAAAKFEALLFYSVLGVIFLAAIPYGSVEPWWKALFQCVIFALAGASLISREFGRESRELSVDFRRVFIAASALVAFSSIQTVPLFSSTLAGLGEVRKSLSADAFQTSLFALHITALGLLGWLLVVHTTSGLRLRRLVYVLIAIGALSAIFGIWRGAAQREIGFLLPYLRPRLGYAQFINSNHFAYLMEMALGLALGIVVCRGVAAKRSAIYLIAAVPMWVALVLANSRGGIFSLLCQVIFLALLLGIDNHKEDGRRKENSRLTHWGRMIAIRVVLITALLAAAVATVVFVGGDPLAGRLETSSIELDRRSADTRTLRQSIWRTTWEMIKDHPIAGVGFGGYATAIPKYHLASGETTPQEAHNDYLELLASGGLIGLGIGAWLAASFVLGLRSQLQSTRRGAGDRFLRSAKVGALAGILTVGIHSLVDFGLHIPANAFIFTALVSIIFIEPEDP